MKGKSFCLIETQKNKVVAAYIFCFVKEIGVGKNAVVEALCQVSSQVLEFSLVILAKFSHVILGNDGRGRPNQPDIFELELVGVIKSARFVLMVVNDFRD